MANAHAQTLELVFLGATAFGTVGATVIALTVTLRGSRREAQARKARDEQLARQQRVEFAELLRAYVARFPSDRGSGETRPDRRLDIEPKAVSIGQNALVVASWTIEAMVRLGGISGVTRGRMRAYNAFKKELGVVLLSWEQNPSQFPQGKLDPWSHEIFRTHEGA